MNGFLDDVLVGLILFAGFGYAAYALGPKSLRARLLTGLAAIIGRLPAFPGAGAVAGRLAEKSRLKSGAACGGCDNCGSDPAPKTAQGSSSDIHVPLSKIGRRR